MTQGTIICAAVLTVACGGGKPPETEAKPASSATAHPPASATPPPPSETLAPVIVAYAPRLRNDAAPVISDIQERAQRCEPPELKNDATLVGQALVLVSIGPKGDVLHAEVVRAFGLPPVVGECLVKAAKTAKFGPPGPQGGVVWLTRGIINAKTRAAALRVAVVDQAKSGVNTCYMQAAVTHPGLQGDVSFRVVVGDGGSVRSVDAVGGSVHEEALLTCMARELEHMSFDVPPGGSVTIPFELKFAGGGSL